MKFKLIIIVMAIGVVISVLYHQYIFDHDCNNLSKIGANEKLIIKIKENILIMLDDPQVIAFVANQPGRFYVRNLDNHFGIEWEELGIPIEYATIEFSGKDLDYSNFNKAKIDVVSIGYGYRKSLIISLMSESKLDDIYPYNLNLDIQKINNNIYLLCR